MRRHYRPSQTVLVLLCVVLLHGLGLWALQSGLMQRVVEAVIAVDVVSDLVELPKPKAELAPPPPPSTQREKATAVAQPWVAAPAPLPVAIADPTPTPNAPSGVGTPSALVPVAVPVAVSTAPAPAPKLELPSSDAEYLHNPKPEYPRLSKQRGEQGRALIDVYIGIDGMVQKAEVKTSSGFERLDQSALATARAWRYVPGKRGGIPEPMWFSVPINFVLE
jgi:periplasmic protein TonB